MDLRQVGFLFSYHCQLSAIKEELIEPELTKQYTDTRTKCENIVIYISVVDQLGLDDIEKALILKNSYWSVLLINFSGIIYFILFSRPGQCVYS